MAQAGLRVPATEAEFPIFEQVWPTRRSANPSAESLSSFSEHIAHVPNMLDDVTPQSLVLLDEHRPRHRPEKAERWVFDSEKSARTARLRWPHTFGRSQDLWRHHPGVVNASMGFDEQTLQPTYVLPLSAGKSAVSKSRAARNLAQVDRTRAATNVDATSATSRIFPPNCMASGRL